MGRNTGRTEHHAADVIPSVIATALLEAEALYVTIPTPHKLFTPAWVRGWWLRYSAPVNVVVHRTFDGQDRVRGELLLWQRSDGRYGGAVMEMGRQRRDAQQVAQAISWYFRHADGAGDTQTAIASAPGFSLNAVERKTVSNYIRWLRAELNILEAHRLEP